MFCVKCGTQVPARAAYCPKCGTPAAQQAGPELVPRSAPMTQGLPPSSDGSDGVMAQPPGLPETPPKETSIKPPTSKPAKPTVSGCISAIIGIGLLALSFTCIYSCFSKSDKNTGKSTNVTPSTNTETWEEKEGKRISGISGDLRKGLDAYLHEDYKTAFATLRPFAAKGNSDAELYLGLMYRDGDGVKVNNPEAFNYIRKASEQGSAEAELLLGDLYRGGIGTKKNPLEAIKWFKKAVDQGNDTAAYQLGDMYDTGDGIQKDKEEAIKWFKIIADKGDGNAKDRIAVIMTQK